MKEAATRTLLQNTVGPALKATVSNPSEIAALAGPLSDALKTCYCKEELKEVELRRVWVQAAPHAEQAFEKFMELLNQVLIISKECSKLRTEQTNMVIQESAKIRTLRSAKSRIALWRKSVSRISITNRLWIKLWMLENL